MVRSPKKTIRKSRWIIIIIIIMIPIIHFLAGFFPCFFSSANFSYTKLGLPDASSIMSSAALVSIPSILRVVI